MLLFSCHSSLLFKLASLSPSVRTVCKTSALAEPTSPSSSLLLPEQLSPDWVLLTQSRPALCNAMDCSLPGFCVCGVTKARVLEWVAIPFSSGSSQSRDWTWVSCRAGRFSVRATANGKTHCKFRISKHPGQFAILHSAVTVSKPLFFYITSSSYVPDYMETHTVSLFLLQWRKCLFWHQDPSIQIFLKTSFNHLISLHHASANPVSSVNPFSEHSNVLWYRLLFEKPSIDLLSPLGYVLSPFPRPSLWTKGCLQILSYFFLPNLSLSHSNRSPLTMAPPRKAQKMFLLNSPIIQFWPNPRPPV